MWRNFVALGVAAVTGAAAPGQGITPPDFTVAFIGDQGLNSGTEAVLFLIRDEGADMVIHSGDFDYEDDPAGWEAQIDAVLGADFPYFACIGNHDVDEFFTTGGYQERMEARMQRLGIPWEGDLGRLSSFQYQGLFVVQTEPGVFVPLDPFRACEDFIEEQLQADDSAWRISSWHKNMRLMQVGGKPNETGWGVYEASRRGGAIMATAHEHSYSRTHLLSYCTNQTVASTDDTLVLCADDPSTPQDEGRSFAFVSGLGGKSIRDQQRDGPWWASVYTSDQGANRGALFGTFNYQGDPCLAHFYFKDIDGVVPDEFFVRSTCGPCAGGSGPPGPPSGTPSAQIVWRNPQTGENTIWLVDGTQVLAGSGVIPSKGTAWKLAGTGDFDANGSPDLLWRRQSTGETTIWLMDEGQHLRSGALPVLSPPWDVAGTGDFDGDGRVDILWRRFVIGENLVWLMDGTTVRPESDVLPVKGLNWSMAGTGDFDADGFADILWRKAFTGENTIWFLEGAALAHSSAIASLTVGWKVAGTRDVDGDGATDILWRQPSSGGNAIWFMEAATARPESGALPQTAVAWSVAGTADFDADGFADILWRNPAGGDNLIWFMQGTSLTPTPLSLDSMDPPWTGAVGE